VRTQATTSLKFDLNAFIQHAVGRGDAIQSSWYLTNVFAGFEIWSGGVGLKTTAFYALVN
jgi:cellulose 1,4-beta-cellobiosidase